MPTALPGLAIAMAGAIALSTGWRATSTDEQPRPTTTDGVPLDGTHLDRGSARLHCHRASLHAGKRHCHELGHRIGNPQRGDRLTRLALGLSPGRFGRRIDHRHRPLGFHDRRRFERSVRDNGRQLPR